MTNKLTHTFADAAYVILFETRSEIHYKELARTVLDRGLFSSKGKTPEQTLRSQVSREVTQKAAEARFVNRDAGIIGLSDHAKTHPDLAMLSHVYEASGMSAAEAAAAAAKAAGGASPAQVAPPPASAPAIPDRSKAPFVPHSGDNDPAKILAPSEPVIPAAPAADSRFIPLVVEHVARRLEEEEAFREGVRTFASEDRDPVEHDAPGDLGDGDGSEPGPITRRTGEQDSDQDFLSVGTQIGEMKSNEYEASMEELAPIVVPPQEGGAAEIAQIPRGNRTALIVKVVRRQGQPQIQLVEELESLVTGVVGRLVLSLPGDQLEDLRDALATAAKVVEHSFPRDEDEAPITRRRRRHN